MIKFFKKSKKPYFGTILGPFCLNLGENGFSWKRRLSVFRYSNYLLSCQKSEKTIEPFLRKTPDGQTDWWTDRQTDNGNFIGPSVGWVFKGTWWIVKFFKISWVDSHWKGSTYSTQAIAAKESNVTVLPFICFIYFVILIKNRIKYLLKTKKAA